MKKSDSPQTTLAGVLAFVAILVGALQAQFDGNPETVAAWAPVVGAAFLAVALWRARDQDVTSEQAGAKNSPGADSSGA